MPAAGGAIGPAGLDAPSVTEGSPHPLERTEAETAQPQRTRDRLSGVDADRKQNTGRGAHVTELAKSPSVEDEAQDERLREIARKRHPTKRRENIERPCGEYDGASVPEREDD